MVNLFNRLTAETDEDHGASGGFVYDLAHIKATATRCIELERGLLAVDDSDPVHVSFVVFDFHSGPSTRDGDVVDGEKMSLVFHGNGPSSSLRELRHTYWGEDGYLFYAQGRLIAAAFIALNEWFDCD